MQACSPATTAVRVLGIDPGLRRTGYAILGFTSSGGARVREAGVVRLDTAAALELRLVELERAIQELIELHKPHVLACEQLYAHYKHPRTALLMSHARGVILAAAARNGLAVVHVGATLSKKLLTGNGHASKLQMQRAVAMTLCLSTLPTPHDVADALAIGLCGWQIWSGAATRRAAVLR